MTHQQDKDWRTGFNIALSHIDEKLRKNIELYITDLLAAHTQQMKERVEALKMVSPNHSDGHASHCRSFNAGIDAALSTLEE